MNPPPLAGSVPPPLPQRVVYVPPLPQQPKIVYVPGQRRSKWSWFALFSAAAFGLISGIALIIALLIAAWPVLDIFFGAKFVLDLLR